MVLNHLHEYIAGTKFSNSQKFYYHYHEPIPNRVTLLKQLSTHKRILHLGCLDHVPLIDSKIKTGQWLHQELTAVATDCLGIDIQQDGIDYVRTRYGFNNILNRDILTSEIPEIKAGLWDYAILGELLEHIDNPVFFLNTIKNKYHKNIKKIIITVPNVLNKNVFAFANQSKEIINTDHRYWFTPYTIAKVCKQAGLEPEEIFFANRIPLSIGGRIKKRVLQACHIEPSYPFTYSSSIVMVAGMSLDVSEKKD